MSERVFILKERRSIAAATTELVLITADDQPFDFIAGQHLEIAIHQPPYQDDGGNRRTFSMANHSINNEVRLAFRNSASAWKRSALIVPIGHQFIITGPYGLFTLPDNSNQEIALIAGGIGITPFRSMIEHLALQNSKRPITLLYANHDEPSAAYLAELRDWSQKGILNLIEHYGPITKLALAPLVTSPYSLAALFYLAGPIIMTNIAMEGLARLGVPRQNILIEQFTGYE